MLSIAAFVGIGVDYKETACVNAGTTRTTTHTGSDELSTSGNYASPDVTTVLERGGVYLWRLELLGVWFDMSAFVK